MAISTQKSLFVTTFRLKSVQNQSKLKNVTNIDNCCDEHFIFSYMVISTQNSWLTNSGFISIDLDELEHGKKVMKMSKFCDDSWFFKLVIMQCIVQDSSSFLNDPSTIFFSSEFWSFGFWPLAQKSYSKFLIF